MSTVVLILIAGRSNQLIHIRHISNIRNSLRRLQRGGSQLMLGAIVVVNAGLVSRHDSGLAASGQRGLRRHCVDLVHALGRVEFGRI